MFCLITTSSLLVTVMTSLTSKILKKLKCEQESSAQENLRLDLDAKKNFPIKLVKNLRLKENKYQLVRFAVLCAKLIIIIASNESVVIRQNILFLLYHVTFFICEII